MRAPKHTRILLDNVLYHIYSRGNQKQKVFFDEQDFKEFLSRLMRYKRRYSVKLYAFCLMPNHFHLILEIKDKYDLKKFMQGLNRSYTAYFNNKYDKVGHLWQNRFKSKIMAKNEYIIDCINYVEHNPVRKNLTNLPSEYRWSSFSERMFDNTKSRFEKITDILQI